MDMCECSVMDSHHFPVEPLEIGDCKKWWIDAAVGLEYLHFQGVVHFDLKPDNILIAKDADGGTRAVLADFGVSRILHEAGDDKESVGASGSPGTPAYTAPEVWAPEVWSHVGKRQYDPKAADVWSLGITLHAMAFGNVPYTGTLPEIMENVAKTEEWTISDDGHDDKNMVGLLRGLITKSPKERMTLADVKKHPWVIGEISKRRRSVEGWQKVEVTDEELRKAIISGHVANFRRTKDGSIFKTTEKSEAHMYNVLNKAESQVKRYLPTVKSPPTRASKGRVTLELADLTHGVDGACLMDIKMGMRAFTDAEDTGPAGERREDMLAKMDKIDPAAATDAEREANGVYKIRCAILTRLSDTQPSLPAPHRPAPPSPLLQVPQVPRREVDDEHAGLPHRRRLNRGAERGRGAGHEGAANRVDGGAGAGGDAAVRAATAGGARESRAAAARDARRDGEVRGVHVALVHPHLAPLQILQRHQRDLRPHDRPQGGGARPRHADAPRGVRDGQRRGRLPDGRRQPDLIVREVRGDAPRLTARRAVLSPGADGWNFSYRPKR